MRWDIAARSLPYLIQGVRITIFLGFLVMLLGTALGFAVGLLRLRSRGTAYAGATAFVEVFRGTPLIMQMFFVFFGLPALGIKFDPLAAAVVAMTLFAAANAAEIVRGAIQSIPRGQLEAARSLGLSRRQAMRDVILPQATRRMIPPMMGLFTTLVKDTSLAAIINVFELTTAARQIVERTLASFEIWLTVAAMYFLISYPLSLLSQRLERRYVAEAGH